MPDEPKQPGVAEAEALAETVALSRLGRQAAVVFPVQFDSTRQVEVLRRQAHLHQQMAVILGEAADRIEALITGEQP